jgi:Fe-S-cluster containining protein
VKEELGSIMVTKNTPKEYIERIGKDCDRCGHCCTFDSGIFLDSDRKRIAKALSIPEAEFTERFLEEKTIYNKKVWKAKLERHGKPFGKCVFLEDKACSIQEHKPIHCRLASGCREYGRELNIWFMLNHVLEPTDPQAIREWAEYLKTHPTIPGGELHELVKDKEMLGKILKHEKLK